VTTTAYAYPLDVTAVVAALRAHAEEIRAARLAKVGTLSDDGRRRLESVTVRILDRFLDLPAARLSQAGSAAERATYADDVRCLFGLGEKA
jgi:glutamyl-tRNA reductase